MCHGGISICITELMRVVSTASCVFFVIKFFAVHQNSYHFNYVRLAGESTLRKVICINRVRTYWVDYFNRWWTCFGHTEEPKKVRNHIRKFAEDVQIWHLNRIYIDCIDRRNGPNWHICTL
jgi:hypothetical protein